MGLPVTRRHQGSISPRLSFAHVAAQHRTQTFARTGSGLAADNRPASRRRADAVIPRAGGGDTYWVTVAQALGVGELEHHE